MNPFPASHSSTVRRATSGHQLCVAMLLAVGLALHAGCASEKEDGMGKRPPAESEGAATSPGIDHGDPARPGGVTPSDDPAGNGSGGGTASGFGSGGGNDADGGQPVEPGPHRHGPTAWPEEQFVPSPDLAGPRSLDPGIEIAPVPGTETQPDRPRLTVPKLGPEITRRPFHLENPVRLPVGPMAPRGGEAPRIEPLEESALPEATSPPEESAGDDDIFGGAVRIMGGSAGGESHAPVDVRPEARPGDGESTGAESVPEETASAATEGETAGETATETATETDPNKGFETVTVFYATDRKAIDQPTAPTMSTWLTATALTTLLALGLALAAWRSRRRWLRWATIGCGAIAIVLAAATTFVAYHAPLIATIEGRPAEGPASDVEVHGYSNERGELQYGQCEVSIPESHQVGELEAPSIWTLDVHERPDRHVVLMNIDPQPAATFFAGLRDRVDESPRRAAFVFVHGFNVTFEDAARRTAQIAYDVAFDGAPIFYSWPSQGGLLQYTIDENNVRWTVNHLRDFLTDVAKRSGAEQIHLVAHSMGNRALTAALRDLSFLPDDQRPKFNEIILTAPDIDAGVFRTDIAPHILKTGERVTLYASSNDTALAYSKRIHGYPRAGDTGEDLLVLPGMDTIDVSAVDTSFLGHNYYGDNRTVLADVIEVLHESKPPAQRKWLRPAQRGPLRYWIFRR